ncbi:Malectin [Parasponia andersonii]|uniref:Malectin n=1 Tax=Parasponia andersonii TaxID=3476 RepID=A0A2P5D969_PARAD|nr:Malectin [Parasponia andersonii]
MFTNDKTYKSLGRRLFDVYIQGKLVLKDFNIAHEAGGSRTTSVPVKGVYGPLISAISVNPGMLHAILGFLSLLL